MFNYAAPQPQEKHKHADKHKMSESTIGGRRTRQVTDEPEGITWCLSLWSFSSSKIQSLKILSYAEHCHFRL